MGRNANIKLCFVHDDLTLKVQLYILPDNITVYMIDMWLKTCVCKSSKRTFSAMVGWNTWKILVDYSKKVYYDFKNWYPKYNFLPPFITCTCMLSQVDFKMRLCCASGFTKLALVSKVLKKWQSKFTNVWNL